MSELSKAIEELVTNPSPAVYEKLNSISLDLFYQAEMKAVQRTRALGKYVYMLDYILPELIEIVVDELQSFNLLSKKKNYLTICDFVRNDWPQPENLTDEEKFHMSIAYNAILDALTQMHENPQNRIRLLLNALSDKLIEGKILIENELQEIAKENKNDIRIDILKKTIGEEEPSWSASVPESYINPFQYVVKPINNPEKPKILAYRNTLNGLSAHIHCITKSKKPITTETINDISKNFNELISTFEKYENYEKDNAKKKGFFVRFKEWASETTKKILGIKKVSISTKDRLHQVKNNQLTLFKVVKAKSQNIIFANESKAIKLVKTK